jgi:hypothetical protein
MDVYQRRRLVALSAIAAIFIVFVLLIRSCGGEDEPTPVTPVAGATGTGGATVLPQSDFIDEADAICLEANTQLAAVDESDPVQAANDKGQIVAGELQQLQTLAPPDDGTKKLDKYLSSLEKAAAAYQDLATAAERGDDTAISGLEVTIDEAFTDAGDAADSFGFKACGNLKKVGEADSGETSSETTTDTGETVAPATTVPAPTTTTPPVEPAPTDTDSGTVTPPAEDTGGTEDSSSGGVSP